MKICLAGPWFKRQGIARYHWGLAEALIAKGHEVVVWSPWQPDAGNEFETEPVEALKGSYDDHQQAINSCDVVHLQSESILIEPGFTYVNRMIRGQGRPPIVQTLHSNCNAYLPAVSFLFVHNTPALFSKVWMVKRNLVQVPMWCPKIDYVDPPDDDVLWIRWKSNGRTDLSRLQGQVDKANQQLERKYRLQIADERKWLSNDELIKLLLSSNLFTPLYFGIDAVARSNTYTWMAAAGRPLLVSDTNWFEGIKNPACVVADREPHQHLVDIARGYPALVEKAKVEAERMRREDTWEALVDRVYLPYYKRAIAGEVLH